jgi:RNA polymerase sigma-70 factor, ECF subfamily
MEHFDEEKVISKAQIDISQFEILYEKYYLNVYWFIYNRVEDNIKAAEITSDVFMKAMENIKKYEYKGLPFLNWLLVISRNEVNLYYRNNKKERKYFVHNDSIDEVKEEIEEEEKQIISFHSLIKILESLPEKEYEIFHLKHFDKKTFREIADITQTNEDNLRVKYHRIKKQLRELILNNRMLCII